METCQIGDSGRLSEDDSSRDITTSHGFVTSDSGSRHADPHRLDLQDLTTVAPNSVDSGGEVSGRPEESESATGAAERLQSIAAAEPSLPGANLPHVYAPKISVGAAYDGMVCRMRQTVLTDEQVASTRALFNEIDVEAKGLLDPNQICALLNTLGYHLTEEELQQAMDDYDVDYKNGLNEDDLIQLVEEVEASTVQKRKVVEAFALMDVDSSGIVDVARLQALLCGTEGGGAEDVPDPLSESEFAYFMLEARAMKDGRFDYRKFVNDLLFSKVPIEPVGGKKKRKGKKKK
ncbi:EF hand domain-containing protein [Toxoplasma gondii GAB2-2007-GAL-DOM2]|uniref:EF hand domain-containing protein n=7 Tax=Toxoplasma gondii TaxID=5811 RepID=S7W6C4_TOXGG|nr:EF hand domain-containing protein [Toxoplasma gondii GT1]KAF4643518.1 EF hand domain-containing protein [Toxoplasma gondii]KFG39267.1 EF hand domain-containing protein [Toxoplasma gondii p89]KFG39767.1 EF hand domain-containing protein [Toxoplasma gondii GAB2-2007-GAL-DOM2]KFG48088.1 EF hand domain-containing protein [Toxoplasma gondii FOU]PUA87026.1 EF hand domain-containing protein [Toxoplasma gondii TgCATBr9]RQX70700.1 EF hand domain-containing protein [Toxoplasma gondii CAST]